MIIDTHAHLYYPEILNNLEEVLSRAKDTGVERIIVPAVNLETSRTILEMSEKHDMIYCALGVHPGEVSKCELNVTEDIEKMLHHEKVVAIGETGLDYYWDKTNIEMQKSFFKLHIELAKSYNLPIVIHTRSSVHDSVQMIKENYNESLSGQFHCFSGTDEELNEILKLENFYISYCGNVTYKNFTDADIVRLTPLNRILSETDSPFLPPVPYRGKKNEPSYIIHTLRKISEIKEVSYEEMLDNMEKNGNELFFK